MYKISTCKPEDICNLNDVKCDKKIVYKNNTYNNLNLCNNINTSYTEKLTIQLPSTKTQSQNGICKQPYILYK